MLVKSWSRMVQKLVNIWSTIGQTLVNISSKIILACWPNCILTNLTNLWPTSDQLLTISDRLLTNFRDICWHGRTWGFNFRDPYWGTFHVTLGRAFQDWHCGSATFMAGKPWGDFLPKSLSRLECRLGRHPLVSARPKTQWHKYRNKIKNNLKDDCDTRCGARVRQRESVLMRQEEELEHRRTRNSANLPFEPIVARTPANPASDKV